MLIVTVLSEDKFRVVAMMDGDCCPALDFLELGEASTEASRAGLLQMLEYVASNGFSNIPSVWSHEVNKEHGIYEFIKGRLRILFFKGANGDIAVCTDGFMKKSPKVDKAAVKKAIVLKASYEAAAGNIIYQRDEE